MMNSSGYLEHTGLVTDTRNGRIKISLTGSGCTACHKSLCMLGDSKAKEVEIPATENVLKAGDEVLVKISPATGYKAVALLYMMPFLLMVVTLLVMMQRGYPEGISGLTSLLSLAPYFILIYGFRKRLGSQCKIVVLKN